MRAIGLVGLLLAGVLAGSSCSRESQPAAPAPSGRPNVLLVTIDTLRADHVGCYGYTAAATPAIDGLASRGVRFVTVMSQAPLTGPSHATILTGLTPLGHGFRNNSGFALPASVHTAAETFRAAGYRTAAFVSGFPLDRRFGFDRGFELYRRPFAPGERPPPDTVRRAFCRRDDRCGDQMGGWTGRRIERALVSVGALLRSARAVRAAG